MAKPLAARARSAATAALLLTAVAAPSAASAQASAPAPGPAAAAAASAVPRPPAWIAPVRISGRLTAAEIGLVINTDDPYSVAVGAYYAARRGLAPEQILRVRLPIVAALSRADFERLQRAIEQRFGSRTQALALAWSAPWAVECNSITGALALGFDAALCTNSCNPSRPLPYFNTASSRPWRDFGLRPSMLLAAPDVEQAKAMIDRGVAADSSLVRRGRPPVHALLLDTGDVHRRVRALLFPPAGPIGRTGVEVRTQMATDWAATPRILMVSTGSEKVDFGPPSNWLPGGLGDHLTSFGGALGAVHGQTTATDWIAAGATASHGSVSEPCNHLQKFPHPQVLLLHYLQGATAIEAYWKSVLWPQQSLFVGEPLAAPFAPLLSGATVFGR
jgi:uncharacterized protein (TIGR03790 family)